jgi:membrane-bound inhibitor of C-type lysozyme
MYSNAKMQYMYQKSPIGLAAASVIALCAAACHMQRPAEERAAAAAVETTPVARTFVFECEDSYNFTARFSENAVWLFLPTQAVQLPQVRSGSGAKYSGSGITFWSKGRSAILETADTSYFGCQNNPAKAIWEHARLNGVDFRATGNEPGWTLEITLDQDMVFTTHYGESSYRFLTPEPDINPSVRETSYLVENADHQMSVRLKGQSCQDSVSGETVAVTVTIELDGARYAGCGKALR